VTDLTRAVSLYKRWHHEAPRATGRFTLKPPRALARVGVVEFIGYLTHHRGKLVFYYHEFAPGSRPVMYANTKLNQFYLLKGRFKMTDRGITDLDANGRALDPPQRYKVVPASRALNPRRPNLTQRASRP